MKKLSLIRRFGAVLPLALLFLLPARAVAADIYEASWEGGHLTATANADFTAATIESVSVSFDQCGTSPDETSCTWRAAVALDSNPASRCNPTTPQEQIVWDGGEQSGNGTVTGGPTSFPLEGCRGQSLVLGIESRKTHEESSPPPWIVISQGSVQGLFTFGYHPVQEAEEGIIAASPPASIEPPPTPTLLTVAPDCRSLTIGNVGYLLSFRRIGCRKAADLATMRHLSGAAPSGYYCRNLRESRGALCWRQGHPQKYVEWRLPGTRSAHT